MEQKEISKGGIIISQLLTHWEGEVSNHILKFSPLQPSCSPSLYSNTQYCRSLVSFVDRLYFFFMGKLGLHQVRQGFSSAFSPLSLAAWASIVFCGILPCPSLLTMVDRQDISCRVHPIVLPEVGFFYVLPHIQR